MQAVDSACGPPGLVVLNVQQCMDDSAASCNILEQYPVGKVDAVYGGRRDCYRGS
jgi:hypothetical protein